MMVRWMLFAALTALLVEPTLAQNSTRKIRTPPGEQAARAGLGVEWRSDVESALAEAKRSGKPVFWYVPSVRRSPMDRKPVIDRYMMGGPFSWPAAIVLLNQHFIPVREVASGALAERYGLKRGVFIEPGYVVLDAEGEQVLKAQQLTTFHPEAFLAPLLRASSQPAPGFALGAAPPELAAAVRAGRWGDVLRITGALSGPTEMWLRGAALFRLGRRSDAIEEWQRLAAAHGEHPLGWKAALEVEAHGPFVHGFEVYADVPSASLTRPPADGTRAPDGVYDEEQLWLRGARFLIGAADEDGVYRDSTYDFGGTDGLPNVHAAVTCLVGEAMLAAMGRVEAGQLEMGAGLRALVERQLVKMKANAVRSDWLALSDRDEIIWARAYALRFLRAWQRRRGADAGEVVPGIRRGVAALIALQPETGVWFHEYGNPFAIATALQALHGARAAGVEIPEANVEKGVKALAFNRNEEGAFSYGQTRPGREPRASLEAAAGRMPLCELALYLFGASDQDKLVAAIQSGERFHGLLEEVRKYDDHANRYRYGGFFFWFDMLGRAEAIAAVEDAASRRSLAAALRGRVMSLPEVDGVFVDSHELGRCYGTAMALLCLDTLAQAAK